MSRTEYERAHEIYIKTLALSEHNPYKDIDIGLVVASALGKVAPGLCIINSLNKKMYMRLRWWRIYENIKITIILMHFQYFWVYDVDKLSNIITIGKPMHTERFIRTFRYPIIHLIKNYIEVKTYIFQLFCI